MFTTILSAMRPHYFLYADADSSFYLKMGTDDTLHHFPNFLSALTFIHRTRGDQGADVTVYDSMGKVALNDMHIESGDYLLFA